MFFIKTREEFPFIYFLIEPNIVFVYKIEELKYLSVNDRSEYGEWTQFELQHGEEFETFNHKESSPLIGRGYFISQDVTIIMIRKINQLIQRQRKANRNAKLHEVHGDIPVHIVCSESTAGALRYGLKGPKTVIAFDAFFGMGPIWELESPIGQTKRFEWMNENINLEQEHYELENKFNNTLLELEDIPDNSPIYLWTANNGGEQTGIRFILSLLKEKDNQIILINVTEMLDKGILLKQDEEQNIFHSGAVHPENLKLLFDQNKNAKPLTLQDRLNFQREWEILAQSKDLIRIWQDGRIESVPEDYFDTLILNTIRRMHSEDEHKFIRAGNVIGDIIGELDEVVGDSYLEYRIRHLIYTGFLELKGVPRSMRHYSVKIR